MRKSTILLNVGLWSFALLSLWMHLRLQDEITANEELRAQLARSDRPAPPGTADRVEASEPVKAVVTQTTPPSKLSSNPSTTQSVSSRGFRYEMGSEDTRKLFDDPEYKRAWRTQTRVGLETQYRDIARILNLPTEMKDRMLDQMVENMLAEHLTPRPADSRVLREQAARNNAAIEEIIGKDRARGLREYHESLFVRQQLDEFRAELGASGDALRNDQMDLLVAQMHGAYKDYEREMRDTYVPFDAADSQARERFDALQRENRKKLDERLRTAASGILSREQLAAYDALQVRRRELDEASQLTMRKMLDQAKKNAPAGEATEYAEMTIVNAP